MLRKIEYAVIMKVRVSEEGLTIPKLFLEGIDVVEIRKEGKQILVVPLVDDPISGLGSQPLNDDIKDASVNHDKYLQ